MKVKVNDGYQVFDDDNKRHTGGDTLEVSDAQANDWIRAGYVTKARETSAPKKTTSKTTATKR
jgi:hypothetical protein